MRSMNLMDADFTVLEPGQRFAAAQGRLGQRTLGRATSTMLWALRIYVAVAIPLVVIAFVRALHT